MKPILKLEWLFALNVSSGFIKNVMNYLKIMKKIILIYFLKIKSIIVQLVEVQSKSKKSKLDKENVDHSTQKRVTRSQAMKK